jgi:hypothetical protein
VRSRDTWTEEKKSEKLDQTKASAVAVNEAEVIRHAKVNLGGGGVIHLY